MPYHPSQQISKAQEALFSSAILGSLLTEPLMLGELPNSSPFLLPRLSPKPTSQLKFNQKLGHLYEDALSELLSANSNYEILAQNYQLITPAKQTLGELDFLLLKKPSNEIIHLELAVKFYLIVEVNGQTLYPGPDARDNFHRKSKRLCEHQLTLTKRKSSQELLPPLPHSGTIKIGHLVHGIFFDHIHSEHRPLPEHASAQVRRRKWLHCNEFSEFETTRSKLRVIPKQLWLCEINEEIFDTLVEVSICELLQLAQQRCTLCIGEPDAQPYFIVPDSWPNL